VAKTEYHKHTPRRFNTVLVHVCDDEPVTALLFCLTLNFLCVALLALLRLSAFSFVFIFVIKFVFVLSNNYLCVLLGQSESKRFAWQKEG